MSSWSRVSTSSECQLPPVPVLQRLIEEAAWTPVQTASYHSLHLVIISTVLMPSEKMPGRVSICNMSELAINTFSRVFSLRLLWNLRGHHQRVLNMRRADDSLPEEHLLHAHYQSADWPGIQLNGR